MLTGMIQFVWPYVSSQSAEEKSKQKTKDLEDVATIRAVDWSAEFETALAEARSLGDVEKQRRQSAETKASAYLAGIAAIITLGLPLCSDFYTTHFLKLPPAKLYPILITFLVSIGYFLGAAWWSFRALAVSVHHRVDPTDYAAIWVGNDRQRKLVAELFVTTRLNRHGVNWKTTCVQMAHTFIFRALFVFTVLAMVIGCWEPVRNAVVVLWPGP